MWLWCASNKYIGNFKYHPIVITTINCVVMENKYQIRHCNCFVIKKFNTTSLIFTKPPITCQTKQSKKTYKEWRVFLPHIATYTYIHLKPFPVVWLFKYFVFCVRDKMLRLIVCCDLISIFLWYIQLATKYLNQNPFQKVTQLYAAQPRLLPQWWFNMMFNNCRLKLLKSRPRLENQHFVSQKLSQMALNAFFFSHCNWP